MKWIIVQMVIISILFLCTGCNSDSLYSISGYVYDINNTNAISGVVVEAYYDKDRTDTNYTDSSGHFGFGYTGGMDSPDPLIRLTFSKSDYKTYSKDVKREDYKYTEGDFRVGYVKINIYMETN